MQIEDGAGQLGWLWVQALRVPRLLTHGDRAKAV